MATETATASIATAFSRAFATGKDRSMSESLEKVEGKTRPSSSSPALSLILTAIRFAARLLHVESMKIYIFHQRMIVDTAKSNHTSCILRSCARLPRGLVGGVSRAPPPIIPISPHQPPQRPYPAATQSQHSIFVAKRRLSVSPCVIVLPYAPSFPTLPSSSPHLPLTPPWRLPLGSAVDQSVKYLPSHEWVKVEGDVATIGISDFAQSGTYNHHIHHDSTRLLATPRVGQALDRPLPPTRTRPPHHHPPHLPPSSLQSSVTWSMWSFPRRARLSRSRRRTGWWSR